MPSQWIVKRGEKEQGPFTSPQLRTLARSGRLRTTDQIRKQGHEKYVPADKVKGLFDAVPPQSLPPQTLPPPAKQAVSAEIPVAEIIEVVEEMPIVLEAAPEDEGSPEDYQGYENSYDEYPVVDYVDYVEYEVPAKSLRRSSNRSPVQNSPRGGRRRDRSARRSKKRRDSDGVSSDIEEGPWQSLMWCMISIAIGVGLFLYIGPEGAEITGRGLIAWTLMALNAIGGRWAILIFFVVCGIGWFCVAITKFTDR
jgi:hypothetical protein